MTLGKTIRLCWATRVALYQAVIGLGTLVWASVGTLMPLFGRSPSPSLAAGAFALGAALGVVTVVSGERSRHLDRR